MKLTKTCVTHSIMINKFICYFCAKTAKLNTSSVCHISMDYLIECIPELVETIGNVADIISKISLSMTCRSMRIILPVTDDVGEKVRCSYMTLDDDSVTLVNRVMPAIIPTHLKLLRTFDRGNKTVSGRLTRMYNKRSTIRWNYVAGHMSVKLARRLESIGALRFDKNFGPGHDSSIRLMSELIYTTNYDVIELFELHRSIINHVCGWRTVTFIISGCDHQLMVEIQTFNASNTLMIIDKMLRYMYDYHVDCV